MDKLKSKDPNEMYIRAKNNGKGHELQFYEFYEWIHNDITRAVYDKNNNSSVITGLESTKKSLNLNLGQIKFGGYSKDGKSSKGSEGDSLRRTSFGFKKTPMTSILGANSGMSPCLGIDDKVSKVLGTANKTLGDL